MNTFVKSERIIRASKQAQAGMRKEKRTEVWKKEPGVSTANHRAGSCLHRKHRECGYHQDGFHLWGGRKRRRLRYRPPLHACQPPPPTPLNLESERFHRFVRAPSFTHVGKCWETGSLFHTGHYTLSCTLLPACRPLQADSNRSLTPSLQGLHSEARYKHSTP